MQVAGTYLVACTPEEVLIIDQHAAHERVLFEELTAARPGEAPRQRLLFPLVVGLSHAEGELAEELLPALEGLGFRASLGAGPSLIVGEVPLPLGRLANQALLQGVFAELAGQGRSRTVSVLAKELTASLACKAAVKAGNPLPPSERIELLRRVLAAEGLSCPHGRPVLLRFGRAQLERMFLR